MQNRRRYCGGCLDGTGAPSNRSRTLTANKSWSPFPSTWAQLGRVLGLILLQMTAVTESTAAARDFIETIEVIAVTPAGAELDASKAAANVQVALAEDIREHRALGLADFMNDRFANVFVNSAQSNPLQPDVQYRGFVGSPLLGLPQGIAVYQNGIRLNEPFGDTVNWALIPDPAIAAVYLVPGSNPVYGQNALGGAVAIQTKSGSTHPGTQAEVYGGSFGRTRVSIESGGTFSEQLSYFAAVTDLDEDGWRDYSPTEALQAFVNVGWQTGDTALDLNMTFADTDLVGNGAAPVSLLELERTAVYTRPDQTQNALSLFDFTASHSITDNFAVTGSVYLRNSDIDTYNGDDSDFEECEGTPGFLCLEEDDVAEDDVAEDDIAEDDIEEGDEEVLIDVRGEPIPANDSLSSALVNRSRTEQESLGFAVEATSQAKVFGHDNSLTLGVALDNSDIRFAASTELGSLDATRLAIPGGVHLGDSFTELVAEVDNASVYIADSFDLSERTTLNLSARYNKSKIKLRDQIGPALSGDHEFGQLNPAAGVTVALTDRVGLFASFAQSNRVPSPVELTCADPDDPCRLPNAFLADPPLDAVVAQTYEVGMRGAIADGPSGSRFAWQTALFQTTNEDDILFISAGELTNQGYFDNVGRTRRRGLELSISGRVGSNVEWFANYTYLQATFLEDLSLPSPNNPNAIGGEVQVSSGDHLPLLPKQVAKSGVSFAITPKLSVSLNAMLTSQLYLRGDEGNSLDPIEGYFLANLRCDYELTPNLLLFLSVDNLFNEEYETFGLLGDSEEVLGEALADYRFESPGAPRGAWLGLRLSL